MITRLLIATLAAAATASAEPAGESRLDYTAPDKWVRSVDPESQLVSLSPPGGNAAVTFSASKEFAGTAEQWMNEVWTGVLEEMKLNGPSVPGRRGEFLTRMGDFIQPDGSKPMLCLFCAVKEGRGESVVYFGATQDLFFAHLPAVFQMINAMKFTSPPASDPSAALSPSAAYGTGASAPEASVPVLAYNEPAGYYRGAGQSPIEYSSSQVNAGVQIYPFRPYTGDIAAAFQRTLLRDWIDPRFQEGPLVGAPQIKPSRVRGATLAMSARFHESVAGVPNERMRMLAVVGNMAAVIDVQANSSYSWQQVGPVMVPMLDSIRVERQSAPPSVAQGPGPGGAAMAGLFMGMKSKYMALTRSFIPALHYYLLSANGRVHCCYDFPPGGNDNAWRSFNFDAAQRADPQNTGRYTVRGNQLLIQMGSESFSGSIRDGDKLVINSVTYERQP